MKKHKWRVFWLLALLLLWLFCSGTAQAGVLANRLDQFPDWDGKPFVVQPARGDLIYPDWFVGEWTVTTTLEDMVAPLAPEIVSPGFESNRSLLHQPITFQARFVEVEPQGIERVLQPFAGNLPRPVVADRAFNATNLTTAYLGDEVLDVKVDPKNPNRQITRLKDDRRLVSIVTARATEAPRPDKFITTEIFQQEFLGIPDIYFNEVENTTAYVHHPDRTDTDSPDIVAEQVTAIYLSPQDPNYFETIDPDRLFANPSPVALYRYRMEFQRHEPDKEIPGADLLDEMPLLQNWLFSPVAE